MEKNQNDLPVTDITKDQQQKDGNPKKESNISPKPVVSEEEKETGKVKENGSEKRETKTPAAEKETADSKAEETK